MMVCRVLPFAILAAMAHGHGQMNYPPSTRQGYAGLTWPGALTGQGSGGYCEQPNSTALNATYQNPLNGACMLFSQPNPEQPNVSSIPMEPTLEHAYRTVNLNFSSGPQDWTRTMPWRAPGSSAVLGSGCGVAGGGKMWNPNGGWPATGMRLGDDPLEVLPKAQNPTLWARGSIVQVAFGIWANHGGGYSYRLCKNHPGQVNEECFQRTSLEFAGDTSWLQHINGSRIPIPRLTTSTGTYPQGSQWTRIPFPQCADPTDTGAKPQYDAGFKDICDHFQFPEPIYNTHGFGHDNSTRVMDGFHDYSVVDKVLIPEELPEGDYLVSWRWDAEQTTQIWQNCADVTIF
eukprot:TRINITY_DN8857_c0_g1_i1.p1 TRINITY_DN8857_c0_g1~~TRINITY_DN8857_c0_g1_i1.p1  ORF type:complete len:345 (+),score=39.24 TRINITY_DN8857_c0_g1_i1:155-1189(+)